MINSRDMYTMDIQTLIYHFDRRMTQLLKDNAKRHMMDAEPDWIIEKIEDDIMPHIEYIANWEPSDEDIANFYAGPTMSEMHEAARQQKKEAWK